MRAQECLAGAIEGRREPLGVGVLIRAALRSRRQGGEQSLAPGEELARGAGVRIEGAGGGRRRAEIDLFGLREKTQKT